MYSNCISYVLRKLIPDFIKDYPDAKEEMDTTFPTTFGNLTHSTFLADSDHVHDLRSRQSVTGLIGYVGSIPYIWYSKRQGYIASSTYAAEFSALCTTIEEAQSLHYMLRCLECNAPSEDSCPTRIPGDNLSVILSSRQLPWRFHLLISNCSSFFTLY